MNWYNFVLKRVLTIIRHGIRIMKHVDATDIIIKYRCSSSSNSVQIYGFRLRKNLYRNNESTWQSLWKIRFVRFFIYFTDVNAVIDYLQSVMCDERWCYWFSNMLWCNWCKTINNNSIWCFLCCCFPDYLLFHPLFRIFRISRVLTSQYSFVDINRIESDGFFYVKNNKAGNENPFIQSSCFTFAYWWIFVLTCVCFANRWIISIFQ